MRYMRWGPADYDACPTPVLERIYEMMQAQADRDRDARLANARKR